MSTFREVWGALGAYFHDCLEVRKSIEIRSRFLGSPGDFVVCTWNETGGGVPIKRSKNPRKPADRSKEAEKPSRQSHEAKISKKAK